MPPTLTDLLRLRRVSPLAARNFNHEFVSVAFMAAGLACVDVNVLGILAQKAFEAGPWVITIIAAADAMANITSLFWTRFLHGANRVRAANALQFCTIACVVAIALTPYSQAWLLAGLAILARIFFTGIINCRTDLWRSNYPRQHRGGIISRLTIAGTAVIASTALLVAMSMDTSASSLQRFGLGWLAGNEFRGVFVVAACLACFGALSFSRVRWRGGPQIMKAERAQRGQGSEHAASPRAMLRVLREDPEYRRFMAAQFVLGAPNLAAVPIFILTLADTFTLDYTDTTVLTRVIPILVPMLVVPLWGRMLDRMHIIRFRSYHSWVFVVANALMAIALLMPSLGLLYLSRVVLGVAFGGGLLAWELGHHDFARRDQAAVYMGVHVTLTGVRGLLAPFAGTLLYQPADLGWISPGLRYPGMGGWAFLLLAAISAVGAVMFVRLYQRTRHQTRHRPGRD